MLRIKHPLGLSRSAARSGFSLVEILVVLAIIGILVALTAAATIQVIGYQRSSNTETNMRTLRIALERQWKAVIDDADKKGYPNLVLSELAAGDGARAKVIWRKLRLMQEFPSSFLEILPQDQMLFTFQQRYGVPPKPTYVLALQQMGVQSSIQIPQVGKNITDESAVCLFLALQVSRGGIAVSPDDMPPGTVKDLPYYDQSLPQQTDPSKMPQLRQYVDSWGYPLAFYRWPTGNADVDQSNPAAPGTSPTIFRDPGDPQGLLMDPGWSGNTTPIAAFAAFTAKVPVPGPRAVFEACCHAVSDNPGRYPATPKSFYMVPVIVSAGKNNALGIAGLDMALDGTSDSMDNIFSYRLRVGQRGD